MDSVNDLLKLFMRQAQLERSMKQPGGARVIDERELNDVRLKLARSRDLNRHPEALQPVRDRRRPPAAAQMDPVDQREGSGPAG